MGDPRTMSEYQYYEVKKDDILFRLIDAPSPHLGAELKQRAIARKKNLKSLAEREDNIWKKVATLIDSKQPAKYDEAVKLLVHLRDVNKTAEKQSVFNAKLKKIREKHHRKPTFLDRLKRKRLTG